MGVSGANLDQLRQPVTLLRRYSTGVFYSIVGLALCVVTSPVALPAWSMKSSGTLFAVQQLPAVRNWATGAVLVGGYLKDATEQLTEERTIVEAERQAFREFAEAVQSMSAPTQSTPGMNTARISEGATGRRQLQDVRQTYRRTVMSIPYFEREYGECLEEHLAAEFNTDVASVVIDGHQFTQPVQQMLVQQAQQSAREREPLLEALSSEAHSLTAARSHLQTIDETIEQSVSRELPPKPFRELVATDSDIRQARQRCERLLAERQHEIHRMNKQFPNTSESLLQEYFYNTLDVTYPVLNAALDRIRQLRDRRSALIQAIARRY